ncbi:TonB-dependent receptor, partial [Ideonella sp. B508-1]|uniref:TonB-dependent receptor n=1 Tax=Ideonella sp. B508-1 TaxID=137716 RepID=UPI001F1C2BA4
MTHTFTPTTRPHRIAPSGAPWRLTAVVLALSAWQPHAHAADSSAASPAAPGETQQIQVVGRHYDNAVGSSDAASEGVIRADLIKARPALRPGEVLEFVPGLIVTQHSGDGKANQYFLRGFNLDHGTDFATSVEGMPVNMPSHGHGQGYSDLNFMIPELVDHIDYRKGPYFASNGDFASAGSADIAYKTSLAPFAQLTLGQHAYRRGLFAGSTTVNDTDTLLGAVELMTNDGPWTVPENLQRHNAVLKYSHGTLDEGFTLEGMAYQAKWTSTDQVPQRLIDAGSYNGQPFGRFDSLDPTDGGNTSRYSLSGEWHRRGADDETHVSAYVMSYRLALWSNFTYAMERPDTGDQFSQRDKRTVSGLKASQAWSHTLGGLEARTELGLQLRHDNARVGLFDTEARKTLSTTRDDDVHETLVGVYAQNQLTWTPWLRSLVGLRADKGYFSVDSLKGDAAAAANTGSAQASKLSPQAGPGAGAMGQDGILRRCGQGLPQQR